ncbi:MAG: arginine repressor [Lachnospiraceae bacterium]|jgi:transcriptional regulator of arginine metabolism|nr:arginine repressor [Lachnospiraceae bacterium]
MKKNRHAKIVELIENYDLETQEELAERLRQEGYDVTQATVSRDIRELKLSKVSIGRGRQKYVLLRESHGEMSDKYVRVLQEGMSSMGMAQSLLIVKTVPGMAMAVAAALDAMHMKEIVGTIAGDDTIMLAVRAAEDAETVKEKINHVLNK